jgi:hypothetical protein
MSEGLNLIFRTAGTQDFADKINLMTKATRHVESTVDEAMGCDAEHA